MRHIAISSSLLVAACAGSPTDNTQPVNRACSVSDCFLQRDVRDFEVIGNTTMIVYVGAQRCAFQIELDGMFCDMTFAPQVFFRSPERRPNSERICSFDRQIGVDGGPFTEGLDPRGQPPTDRFGQTTGSQCRILSVESLTDDELIELYVDSGKVAPPPPIGPGQIQVGGDASEVDEGSDGAESESSGEEEPTSSVGRAVQ